MSDTKHTPGEWRVEDDFGRWIHAVTIPDDGGDIICNAPDDSPYSFDRWPANRDRIVLCHNCHDDLVAALKYCRNSFERYDNEAGYDYHSVEIAKINAALDKAGEK